jgi:hypothetical protein
VFGCVGVWRPGNLTWSRRRASDWRIGSPGPVGDDLEREVATHGCSRRAAYPRLCWMSHSTTCSCSIALFEIASTST